MRHPVTRTSFAATALLLFACAFSPQHPDLKPPPAYKFADGPGPYSFDCDAPRGSYVDFSIRPPEGEIRITGWFRFIQGKIDVNWASVASVALDGSPGFGLQAVVRRGAPDLVTFDTIQSGKGGGTDFGSTVLSDRPIVFTVTRSTSDRITVSVGEVTKTVRIVPFDVKRIYLSCSTGHVVFSNIAVNPPKAE
jgi:hypothetical protein